MVLTVFNTLARGKEKFQPLHEQEVRMYVCGPTVYDHVHIGNARAFIVADVVRRYLEYKGFSVKMVSNITDIDDKMIKRANETGLNIQQLGEIYSDIYFEDMAKLNLRKPNVNPRATQHIPEIIEKIEALVANGHAYAVDGDVYFDVSKSKDYGKLSGNRAKALKVGARVEVNPKKRNPADFALWKQQRKGELGYHSPWGKGRPGWHIECSTMASEYLGETLDIHMGGKDLIFPHHENEIAQAEAVTEKPFARYWLHNEWLTVDGKKMSKSLANFVTVRDALKTCKPQVLRFFLISAHYRSTIDYNKESLSLAEANLEKLSSALARFKALTERENRTLKEEHLLSDIEDGKRQFEAALDDDFNTPLAISAIFNMVKAMNIYAENNTHIEGKTQTQVARILGQLLDVLGIAVEAPKPQVTHMEIVEGLVELIGELRQEMRQRKDWKTADKIRDKLQELGVVMEDTPEGTRWKMKS